MSPLGTSARTSTGAGIITTTVLVLLFGNQAFAEWVDRHAHDNTWGFFLRTLAWPRWAFGPANGSTAAVRTLIANDLRAILLIVFVAAVLGMSASSISRGAGAFFVGWFALILASAVAAMLTAFITANSSLLGALLTARAASSYGLFVGWIVGIAVAAAKKG